MHIDPLKTIFMLSYVFSVASVLSHVVTVGAFGKPRLSPMRCAPRTSIHHRIGKGNETMPSTHETIYPKTRAETMDLLLGGIPEGGAWIHQRTGYIMRHAAFALLVQVKDPSPSAWLFLSPHFR